MDENRSNSSQDGGLNSAHYIVGLLFLVVGLLVILVFVSIGSEGDSLAETGTASTTVDNVAATIDEINFYHENDGVLSEDGTNDNAYNTSGNRLPLTEATADADGVSGAWFDIYLSDDNGWSDVDDETPGVSVSLNHINHDVCSSTGDRTADSCKYFTEDAAGGTYSPSCTLQENGDSKSALMYCNVEFSHFTESGEWEYAVTVDDGEATDIATGTIWIESGNGIVLENNSIAFSALTPGTEIDPSGSDQQITIKNSYNTDGTGVDLSMDSIGLSKWGTIWPDYFYVSPSSTSTIAESQQASSTPVSISGFSIPRQTLQGAANEQNAATYWGISLPSSADLEGSGSGSITFTAN